MCEGYGVSELAVFGSVLRDDFDPSRSDVDFLVRFTNNDSGPWRSKYLDVPLILLNVGYSERVATVAA